MKVQIFIFGNTHFKIFYRSQTKWREGNVFTPVCDSVQGVSVQGVSVRSPDMVEERVVRILLECILVDTKIEIISDTELKQLVLFTQSEEDIYENMKVHFQFGTETGSGYLVTKLGNQTTTPTKYNKNK